MLSSPRIGSLFCHAAHLRSLRRVSAFPTNYEGLHVSAGSDDGVFSVELNRPESRNAFTMELWKNFGELFSRLSDHAPCRAIVLSGNGKSFCAGIDLKSALSTIVDVINNDSPGNDVARKARELRKLIQVCQNGFTAVEKCQKPVIAAIHGHCIGAGISLAGCCDIRYAANDAIFSIKEVAVGLAADVGILQRVQHLIGNDSWARELAFTAKDVSAPETLHHGLVSRLFNSKEECLASAMELAKEIASRSPVAVQGTKLALNYARNHSVEDALEWVLTWNQSQLQTEDLVKSGAAALSKEKAVFENV